MNASKVERGKKGDVWSCSEDRFFKVIKEIKTYIDKKRGRLLKIITKTIQADSEFISAH